MMVYSGGYADPGRDPGRLYGGPYQLQPAAQRQAATHGNLKSDWMKEPRENKRDVLCESSRKRNRKCSNEAGLKETETQYTARPGTQTLLRPPGLGLSELGSGSQERDLSSEWMAEMTRVCAEEAVNFVAKN